MLHFLRSGKRKSIASFVAFILIFAMMPYNTFVYADEISGGESETRTWNFKGGQEGAFEGNIEGTSSEFEGLLINAENGKCSARDSGDTQINPGTKLCVPVSGSAIIMVDTSPGYHDYTINGVTADSDDYAYTYTGSEGYVEIEANSTVYLYEISETSYDSNNDEGCITRGWRLWQQ